MRYQNRTQLQRSLQNRHRAWTEETGSPTPAGTRGCFLKLRTKQYALKNTFYILKPFQEFTKLFSIVLGKIIK